MRFGVIALLVVGCTGGDASPRPEPMTPMPGEIAPANWSGLAPKDTLAIPKMEIDEIAGAQLWLGLEGKATEKQLLDWIALARSQKDARAESYFETYLGQHYRGEGEIEKAIAASRRSYALDKDDEARRLTGHENLAVLLSEGGATHWKEAETILLGLLAKRIEGEARASVLWNLGVHFHRRSQLAVADKYFRQALPLYVKDADIGATLHEIGRIAFDTNKFADAVPWLEKAAAARQKAGDEQRGPLTITLSYLATTSDKLRKPDEAVAYRKRQVDVTRAMHGDDSLELASDLSSLGATYVNWDREREGIPHLERALAIQEAAWGKQDARLTESLLNLGAARRWVGELETAETLYVRAEALQVAALGADHADTRKTRGTLAKVRAERRKK